MSLSVAPKTAVSGGNMEVEFTRLSDGGREMTPVETRSVRRLPVSVRAALVVSTVASIFLMIAYSAPYFEWITRMQKSSDFQNEFQGALSRINQTQVMNDPFVPQECSYAVDDPYSGDHFNCDQLLGVLDRSKCIKWNWIKERVYNQTLCGYANRVFQEWLPVTLPLMLSNVLMGARLLVMNCQSQERWDSTASRVATFVIGAGSFGVGVMGVLRGYNLSGSWSITAGLGMMTTALVSHKRVANLFSYLGQRLRC